MSINSEVKVWDLAVRVFHWSLVVLFVISYLSGDELETLHAWSGYGVAGLLVFRLVWGFIGTRHARFSDFIYSPARVKAYLTSLTSGSPQHYLGHNPAGGWMVIALLLSLSLTVWSGLEAYAVEGHGPLAADIQVNLINAAHADDDEHEEHGKSGEKDEFWEEIHEFFANFTLLLVFVHILGVVVASHLHGENLVRAMINGKKAGD